MAEKCGEIEFISYGREGGALVEVVTNLKYLGSPLDQTDDDWPVLRRNFKWARRVWGRLGNMLRREGLDSKVAAMFYRAGVQTVILFGSESWVLYTEMEKMVEWTQTRFLRQITGKRERRMTDRTWFTPAPEEVRK